MVMPAAISFSRTLSPSSVTCSIGSRRAAGHGLHLLLDLLTLLLFALDVDLPLEELGGETNVLALLADGERELGVVDDDLDLLVAEVGDGDAADLGGLQGLFGEGGDLVGVLDDVDLFAAQFADDGLDAHALHADAGADGVDVLVAAHDGDLGALAGLAGDGADGHGAVVDLGDLGLEEVLDEGRGGAGDDDLRALGGAVDAEQDDADALAYGELLEAGLLALGHAGFGFAEVEDDVHRLEALDGGVEDLAGAVVVLVEDGVALGFADLLEDDLLGHLGGDASEGRGVLVEAEFAADFDLGGEFARLLERHLVDLVFDLLGRFDDGLEDVGADLAGFAVHLGAHVLLRLVVLAGGEGDGVLNGANDYVRLDALVPAQRLDRLIQNTCHRLFLHRWLDCSRACCYTRRVSKRLNFRYQVCFLDVGQSDLDDLLCRRLLCLCPSASRRRGRS